MEMRLDDGLVSRITVPRGKRDVLVFDTETPGLFLRKFASGRAIYGVKFAINGQPRRVHIRDAGERGSLAKARSEALDVRAKARLGSDVLAEREAAKVAAAAEAKRKANTLGNVAKKYLEARESELRPRSYVEVCRHINKRWKPLHARPIESITRADLVETLDGIERDHGKVEADRARTSLTTLYAWAIDRGHVAATPLVHLKSRAGNVSRDRVLTPVELGFVWRAAQARGDDYGRIVSLLILTGQRRQEIGALPWTEVLGDRLDLPPERTKNGRPHVVPLSPPALAQLPARPAPNDPEARAYVFGRTRYAPFSGWGKAKGELDEAVAEARRKAGIRQAMAPFVLHDLRRTFVTLVGEMGLAQPHVIEAIVNHVSGHKGGVAGVYNKSTYWDERVKALDAWGRWVQSLT
jgi:integrase